MLYMAHAYVARHHEHARQCRAAHLDKDSLLFGSERLFPVRCYLWVKVCSPSAAKLVGQMAVWTNLLAADSSCTIYCTDKLLHVSAPQRPTCVLRKHARMSGMHHYLRLQDFAVLLGWRPGAWATKVHLFVPCFSTSLMRISSSYTEDMSSCFRQLLRAIAAGITPYFQR